MTQLLLFTLCALALLINAACKKDIVEPPANPLQLTVEDVSCVEATLKISLASGQANRTVTVKRNDSVVTTITLATVDTLITEVNLLPKKTYTYTASAGSWKTTVQITTLDTTSHTIHWQTPDTLGVYGLIRDVWVFSRDNAWAVGEIILPDSTGKPDMSNPYNAAHWDGSKWEPVQIPTAGFVGSGYYPIYTIFAFTPNDIWTFSEAGSYSHWNGQTWTTAYVAERQGGGQKLWGTNSSNLFLVGTNGSISKYNGSTWTKMESHTTVDLQDVWGIDNEHVWATGLNSNDGHSVVLQYDGKQWTTIYDSDTQPFHTKYQFSRVWTDVPYRIYLDGGSGLHIMNLNDFNISSQINTGQTYISYCLRGTGQNDVFDGGPAGEFAHGNGYSWYLYPEFKTLNEGDAWFTSVYPTTDFVLIGGLYLTALNGFPVVIRGYR